MMAEENQHQVNNNNNNTNRDSPNLTKTMKRSNKPLMEKRRRERINSSLEQLKTLVLEALNRDTSQYSKLEKADILEMTVKHLRGLQRQQLHMAAATDNTVVSKYRAGFTECAQEVTRYLGQVDGLAPDTRSRLMQHLGTCVQRVHHDVPNAPSTTSVTTGMGSLHGVHMPTISHIPSHTVQTPLHVQMPASTSMSTLPGTATSLAGATISPQQHALMSAAGLPLIPAFSLSQLPVLGGLVIPTNSFSLQQQGMGNHPQQQSTIRMNTSCQNRDINNNDVNTMPSLMGKQSLSHDISHIESRCESRDSCSSRTSSQYSNNISSSASLSSSSSMSSVNNNMNNMNKTLPLVPEPIKPEPSSPAPAHAPKVVVPQPQLGSMWRPWSGSLLVH